MGQRLSEQAELRLLPCTLPQLSHCWKKVPSNKPKCLQCFGMYHPMAVSRNDARYWPWLKGFDPSSLQTAGTCWTEPATSSLKHPEHSELGVCANVPGFLWHRLPVSAEAMLGIALLCLPCHRLSCAPVHWVVQG